MAYGVADAHGLWVLFPKDYDRYLRLIDDYGLYAEEFNLAPSLADGDLLASPLLDVLDVRTVVAERDVPISGSYRIAVDAPAGGFLRVGSRWDTGWSATVDGDPAKVLRADGVFRGVAVPPGRHTVAFSYRYPDEMRGRLVAGAALVLLVALVAAGGKSARDVNRKRPASV
jgi:hypothetical protein